MRTRLTARNNRRIANVPYVRRGASSHGYTSRTERDRVVIAPVSPRRDKRL